MYTPYGHITTPRELEEGLQKKNNDIAKSLIE
jgi:hypothetical protein